MTTYLKKLHIAGPKAIPDPTPALSGLGPKKIGSVEDIVRMNGAMLNLEGAAQSVADMLKRYEGAVVAMEHLERPQSSYWKPTQKLKPFTGRVLEVGITSSGFNLLYGGDKRVVLVQSSSFALVHSDRMEGLYVENTNPRERNVPDKMLLVGLRDDYMTPLTPTS